MLVASRRPKTGGTPSLTARETLEIGMKSRSGQQQDARDSLLKKDRPHEVRAACPRRIFFRNPILFRSAQQPAIRLHLMRDRVKLLLAGLRRERAGLVGRRESARSRIRCSWRLDTVRVR